MVIIKLDGPPVVEGISDVDAPVVVVSCGSGSSNPQPVHLKHFKLF